MIQNKILKDLKSEFDLRDIRERFLFYYVARELKFRYVDIVKFSGKSLSNIFHLLKYYEVEDSEQKKVNELVKKYKIENYLK